MIRSRQAGYSSQDWQKSGYKNSQSRKTKRISFNESRKIYLIIFN